MEFLASNENVRVIGRTLYINEVRYLSYSCSAIEFECVTKKVVATLWTDGEQMDKAFKAQVAVFINDEEEPRKRFALEVLEGDYVLYESEKEESIKIRLVKYSEAAFGKVGIKKLKIDSKASPKPTANKERQLEFVGDSITCGFGIEGKWNVDDFCTAQENPWQAYAAKAARALKADYHLVAWSGIGVLSCWTEDYEPNQELLMPRLYDYTDLSLEQALGHKVYEHWEESNFKPDCVIINLGTNDASYTKQLESRLEAFGESYYQFLKQVRRMHPESMIICTLGAMGQDLYPEILKQVDYFREEEQDEKVTSLAFDVQLESDGIGAQWHPSFITHEKMAKKLIDKINEVMNW